MRKTLFTIGHSTHSLEHFVNLLTKHGVQAVADVRSVPYSRRNPQFNRKPLMQHLQASGIAYVFLGKELGAHVRRARSLDVSPHALGVPKAQIPRSRDPAHPFRRSH